MNPNEGYLSCCFTGHRNVPPQSADAIRYTLERLIYELYENGCREFISGGAIGFDTIAAETVIKFKKMFPEIRLIMALPCRDQHIKWGKVDRLRYEKLLSLADKVIYLTERYVTGCMHLRNKYMVDNSDLCIAYFENKGGGTEYTINYAREQGRKVVNIAHML